MNQTRHYFTPNRATPGMSAVTVADGLEPEPSETPVPRGTTLGRYLVLDTLGQGGMGIVVEAFDATLDRRVALKLLHAGVSADPEHHARLIREAQALAKLSHRCVVGVYDVGELDDQVFIAMEFIDGPNVRTWIHEHPRTPAQILAVYRDAGRGLQAAHDAGIVHRDFKPDNVLIGSDGRARVTDFGLALDAQVAGTMLAEPVSSVSTSGRLTEAGMVMGTPAYMPIEQHAGKPTDHRADQFSFCVSLYESLYGVRPFIGASGAEYCRAIEKGSIPGPPAGVSVPRRVHAALLRGLCADPADRFPSMRALLRATAPERSSRTWIAAGVGGLALGAGFVALADADPPQRPCSGFDDDAAEVWNAETRAAIESAFSRSELPHATASARGALEALDDFAARWADSATAACTASERGEQSDEMLDLRMHCLDRGLLAMEAMARVLADVGPEQLDDAPHLVAGLPDLEVCADLDTLPNLTVLPPTTEQADEARRLLPVLERVSALIVARRSDEARDELDTHHDELEGSSYPLVRALHLMWAGRLAFERIDSDRGQAMLVEAHHLALRHGLDVIAARTATNLGMLHARASELDAAGAWHAAALALARASGSTRLEASTTAAHAPYYAALGKLDDAVAATQRALELVEDDETFPARARVELLLSHAERLHERDGADAGLEQLREAQQIVSDADGTVPALVDIEAELTRRATFAGDYDAALVHARRTAELTRETYGADHPKYAVSVANVAVPLKELGRHEEAVAHYEQARKGLGQGKGAVYAQAQLRCNMANLLLGINELQRARRQLEAASSIIEDHGLQDRSLTVIVETLWTNLLRLEGDLDASRLHGESAVENSTRRYGEPHFRTSDALTALARTELEAGENDRARALVERSLQYETTVAADLARAQYVLGRVLWEADDDRARALELLRSARELLESAPSYALERDEVSDWLDEHP